MIIGQILAEFIHAVLDLADAVQAGSSRFSDTAGTHAPNDLDPGLVEDLVATSSALVRASGTSARS